MKVLEQILVAVDLGPQSDHVLATASESKLTIPRTKVSVLTVRSLECIRRKTTRWKYL